MGKLESNAPARASINVAIKIAERSKFMSRVGASIGGWVNEVL